MTGLFSGKRVSKSSTYIEAYGTVDELNALIGFCRSSCTDAELTKDLLQIQHDLHEACGDLATPLNSKAEIKRISPERALRLEARIDALEPELKPLQQFILAGGAELSARLHMARTVCRRAERLAIRHAEAEKINGEVVIYLNRLSDFLFVLARVANHRAKVEDTLWDQMR